MSKDERVLTLMDLVSWNLLETAISHWLGTAGSPPYKLSGATFTRLHEGLSQKIHIKGLFHVSGSKDQLCIHYDCMVSDPIRENPTGTFQFEIGGSVERWTKLFKDDRVLMFDMGTVVFRRGKIPYSWEVDSFSSSDQTDLKSLV